VESRNVSELHVILNLSFNSFLILKISTPSTVLKLIYCEYDMPNPPRISSDVTIFPVLTRNVVLMQSNAYQYVVGLDKEVL
jgi:hypothetical protein